MPDPVAPVPAEDPFRPPAPASSVPAVRWAVLRRTARRSRRPGPVAAVLASSGPRCSCSWRCSPRVSSRSSPRVPNRPAERLGRRGAARPAARADRPGRAAVLAGVARGPARAGVLRLHPLPGRLPRHRRHHRRGPRGGRAGSACRVRVDRPRARRRGGDEELPEVPAQGLLGPDRHAGRGAAQRRRVGRAVREAGEHHRRVRRWRTPRTCSSSMPRAGSGRGSRSGRRRGRSRRRWPRCSPRRRPRRMRRQPRRPQLPRRPPPPPRPKPGGPGPRRGPGQPHRAGRLVRGLGGRPRSRDPVRRRRRRHAP